jgi:hypothetical protein
MDFKIESIGDGGAVGLVPTSTKTPPIQQKLAVVGSTVVLASDFRDSNSEFTVHPQ